VWKKGEIILAFYINSKKIRPEFKRMVLRKKIIPWLFLLPILLLHLFVTIGPSISSIYYSLTDWSGLGTAKFIGIGNFQQLWFNDKSFISAFSHNSIWLFYCIITFVMALLVASLLAPLKKGGIAIRTVLFIPFVLSSVVTASIWRNLLNPDRGIGAQLAKIGIYGLDKAFLGITKTSLFTVFFIDNWHWWVFIMVLLLTAMQNIPKELYEAARVDGVNRWQEFRYVTLPGIRPTLFFLILMTGIWTFQTFDYIWILTYGGPAGSSEVLGTLVLKNAFIRLEAGYAAAIGLTMSLFSGILVSIFVYLKKKGLEI